MTNIGPTFGGRCLRCALKEFSRKRRARPFSTSTSRQAINSQEEYRSAKQYCTDLLRKSDSPSYTVLYCLPPHLHDFHIATRALNIELARIPDTVSHPTVGTMRMTFWRDTILSTLSGSPPRGQPVAILLASALESLSTRSPSSSTTTPSILKSWFLRLLSARESRLTNAPFPTIESLESYAESTYSTLLYLSLSAIPISSLPLDHVASHIGKATGIIAVLRGFPLIAFPQSPSQHHNNPTSLTPSSSLHQGAITLPLNVLAKHSVEDESLFRLGPQTPGIRDAAFEIATRASDHLITARSLLSQLRAGQSLDHPYEYEGEEGHIYSSSSSSFTPQQGGSSSGPPDLQTNHDVLTVPGALGSLLTSAVPSRVWLERLEKVDFDLFDARLRGGEWRWRLPWRVWWSVRRGVF